MAGVAGSEHVRALFAGGARPRAYVASPLGFSEVGRAYYAERYLPALRDHVEPVDPWALADPQEFAAARAAGREHELGLEVGARNAAAIAGSQLVIAHLDGQEVDAGTAAEVGYAAALGPPVPGRPQRPALKRRAGHGGQPAARGVRRAVGRVRRAVAGGARGSDAGEVWARRDAYRYRSARSPRRACASARW